jgi:hypothetical protein
LRELAQVGCEAPVIWPQNPSDAIASGLVKINQCNTRTRFGKPFGNGPTDCACRARYDYSFPGKSPVKVRHLSSLAERTRSSLI